MRWARLAIITLPLRRIWWMFGWGAIRMVFCRRLEVTGWSRVPAGPVVFAANHASHADTALLEYVCARHRRGMVLAAAAEDYFFSSRCRGVPAAILVGAFPFPRRGTTGLATTGQLIDRGWSVIMFPQGSRAGGPFRRGVGVLLQRGATVVPVRIDGTARMLPRGRFLPRRAHVSLDFGLPIVASPGKTSAELARQVEAAVRCEAA